MATGCSIKNATWFRLITLALVVRVIAPRWWIKDVVMNAIYSCMYLDSSVPCRIGMYLVRMLKGRVSFCSRLGRGTCLKKSKTCPPEVLMPKFPPEVSNGRHVPQTAHQPRPVLRRIHTDSHGKCRAYRVLQVESTVIYDPNYQGKEGLAG